MNPLLPLEYFVPDGEPHVMSDGRLYLYGSLDVPGRQDYCSDEYRVFSTDDPKLERWTDHGVSMRSGDPHMCPACAPGTVLYAPDCVEKDGRYFLFFPTSDGRELVAHSDAPCGPFHGARDIEGVSGDGIDPAVLADDDGSCYLFWGQFSLRGAKLSSDMCGIDRSTLRTGILTEYEHGFHEGASIRKFGGKYYLIFTDVSRGRATCLSYAVSDSPLGPYTKKGVLIDNARCDAQTWNDHGSLVLFKGRYFIFYHRSSRGSRYSRRACAEEIRMLPDGTFTEAVQTSSGASGAVSAYTAWDSCRACCVSGDIMISSAPDGGEMLTRAGGSAFREEYAAFRYLDFAEGGACSFFITARGSGSVRAVAEGGLEIARVSFDCAGDPRTFSTPATSPRGVHALWLLFTGAGIDVLRFGFTR